MGERGVSGLTPHQAGFRASFLASTATSVRFRNLKLPLEAPTLMQGLLSPREALVDESPVGTRLPRFRARAGHGRSPRLSLPRRPLTGFAPSRCPTRDLPIGWLPLERLSYLLILFLSSAAMAVRLSDAEESFLLLTANPSTATSASAVLTLSKV